MRYDFFYALVVNTISDLIQLFYIYWTQTIISWVLDPDATIAQGAVLCAVFTGSAFIAAVFKRSVVQTGCIMAVKIRKLLIGAMYGKLGKLSVKSVASTNSGKLITLVSADIFMVERGLAFTPLVFSAPIINIAVVIVVGITTHWSNSIIVFVFYITMLGCQTLSG